jgi:hypothetical protein
MSRLFRFSHTSKRDSAVDGWFQTHDDELGLIARQWFEILRNCGDHVNELLHDGQPTACVGDVAFAYVNAFKAHINLGFFHGAELDDTAGLLEGTGKFMRHVKLWPSAAVNTEALTALIESAYADVKGRIASLGE